MLPKLLATLRRVCDRMDRRLEGNLGPAPVRGWRGDPWDAGYHAGRRAGSRHGAERDELAAATPPYPANSPAASQWQQGFQIGFCDGADERR